MKDPLSTEPWVGPDYTEVWHGAVHAKCLARISALENRMLTGHCVECGCDSEKCQSYWKRQKKCCPECSHVKP